VKEVIESHRYLLEGWSITLEAGVTRPVTIHAPRRPLVIAVSNLLRNAVQNTPNGAVTVRFTDGRLIVDDSGFGIQGDRAREVFRLGVSGDDGKETGYGLGLHIVHRIGQSHGREVTPEIGSTGGTQCHRVPSHHRENGLIDSMDTVAATPACAG